MKSSTLHLHSKIQVGPVDARIFGGFLEHMGRAIYHGLYDPDCAHADEDGFRTDVLDSLRRLRMTAMRYPGGNFVSGYHWLDGVSLRLSVDGPTYATQSYGVAPYVDASAILSGEDLHVFTTNRDTAESMEINVQLADRPIVSLVDAEVLTGSDAKAANSFEEPDRVKSRAFDDVTIRNGRATYELPPLSVAALTFRTEG